MPTVRSAFFLAKKTQGGKTQEFKKLKEKTQTQAQKPIFRHNQTKNSKISVWNLQSLFFPKIISNYQDFLNIKNLKEFSQKLKQKNSISGISKIFRCPESGEKKAELKLS